MPAAPGPASAAQLAAPRLDSASTIGPYLVPDNPGREGNPWVSGNAGSTAVRNDDWRCSVRVAHDGNGPERFVSGEEQAPHRRCDDCADSPNTGAPGRTRSGKASVESENVYVRWAPARRSDRPTRTWYQASTIPTHSKGEQCRGPTHQCALPPWPSPRSPPSGSGSARWPAARPCPEAPTRRGRPAPRPPHPTAPRPPRPTAPRPPHRAAPKSAPSSLRSTAPASRRIARPTRLTSSATRPTSSATTRRRSTTTSRSGQWRCTAAPNTSSTTRWPTTGSRRSSVSSTRSPSSTRTSTSRSCGCSPNATS